MILAPVMAHIQTCSIAEALESAGLLMRAAAAFRSRAANYDSPFKLFYLASEIRNTEVGLAYLNRACELACVPLAQYYVEVPSGIDLVWVTYRPEALPDSPDSDPAAMVYLGSVDDLTEDQARSRAMGW